MELAGDSELYDLWEFVSMELLILNFYCKYENDD